MGNGLCEPETEPIHTWVRSLNQRKTTRFKKVKTVKRRNPWASTADGVEGIFYLASKPSP